MPAFTKQSLETLRQKIHLVEVVSSHLLLKKTGAFYKALCPFHNEKSPSFVIQPGDSHYHCFGCGAHGDAIQFLMNFLKMSFVEAVEYLAEKFQVSLEQTSKGAEMGPDKKKFKEILEKSCRLYQYVLLHTKQGQEGLSYLYRRGIDLRFIRMFRIGLALKEGFTLQKYLKEYTMQDLKKVGLATDRGRDFFSDRIMIPIFDPLGKVIGYTSRKFKEETFGPKYINTFETPLFKKSKVLFGLNYCRKTIAKQRKVLLVEGQFDALRLIYSGFTWTVAGQGTAIGKDHVQELVNLGVKTAYLALDSDLAGVNAAIKVGDLFQKEGIEVYVVSLPKGADPDSYIREKGKKSWEELINTSIDYLTFLVQETARTIQIQSPAHKADLVRSIAAQIEKWDHPLMVHESLRKLARLTQTPESMITEKQGPNVFIQKKASLGFSEVNADQILESDLLRWLFLMGQMHPVFKDIVRLNLQEESFKTNICRHLYRRYLTTCEEDKSCDLLSLAIATEGAEEQLFLAQILQKKVDREKAEHLFIDTVQKILDRNWMEKREEIKEKILSGKCSEDQALSLAKEFDEIKRSRPIVKLPDHE